MENNTRKIWLDSMLHIVTPVLQALEKEELKKTMPLDFHGERAPFAPLEAFGRSMLGLAPWLEAEGVYLLNEYLEVYRRYVRRSSRYYFYRGSLYGAREALEIWAEEHGGDGGALA